VLYVLGAAAVVDNDEACKGQIPLRYPARSWSQTGSKPNSIPLRYPGRRQVRSWFEAGRRQVRTISFEPVCDQLRTCFEAARELDSVMEFGFNF